MNLFDLIKKIFVIDFTSLEVRQKLITYIFSVVGICAFTVFGIDAIIREVYLFATVLFIGDILTILMVLYLRKTNNVVHTSNAIVVILFFTCLFLVFNVATYDRTAPLWLYVFPPTALFAMGHRRGLKANILLVLFAFIFFIFVPELSKQYDFFYLSRYFTTLSIVILLSYVFEYARERTFQALKAANDAERMAEAKNEFLANMSHELRTPMNAIIGFSSILLGEVKDPKHLDYLEQIDKSSNKLVKIIDDVLSFSDLDNGRYEIEVSTFNIKELFDEIVKSYSEIARVKGIQLKCDSFDDLPKDLISDRSCLKKILSNFVDNAIKFTDSGEVVIGAKIDEVELGGLILRIYVKDTGKGMSSEEINVLFNSFAQSDTSLTRSFGGVGLGLSIAQKLAKIIDGEIKVKSKVNKGSEFAFTAWFGIDEDHTDEIENKAISRHEEDISGAELSLDYVSSRLAGTRWLVAEDNSINRMIIEEFLNQIGIKFVMSEDGLKAFQQFENGKFDAVLTDIQMPELDGFGLTKLIREHPDGKDIPIIAVTSHSIKGYRKLCLDSGMDDYITKPINQDELYRTLLKNLNISIDLDSDTKEMHQSSSIRDTISDSTQQEHVCKGFDSFDSEAAMKQIGGNKQLFKTMLFSFEDQYHDAEQQLLLAFDNGADEDALRLVHTIKGLAGSLAAKALHKKSVELEGCMKSVSKNLSRDLLEPYFESFCKELNKVCVEISVCKSDVSLQELAKGFDEVKRPSPEKITKLCSSLQDLLEENNFQAKDVAEEMQRIIDDHDLELLLGKIILSIGMFNFDTAKEEFQVFIKAYKN